MYIIIFSFIFHPMEALFLLASYPLLLFDIHGLADQKSIEVLA